MSVTQNELDSFHRFASEKLSNGGTDLTMDELYLQWQLDRERAEINERIRQGIAEADAGLGRPIDEFMEAFREKHNIPEDV